jgi:hypothetical protein
MDAVDDRQAIVRLSASLPLHVQDALPVGADNHFDNQTRWYGVDALDGVDVMDVRTRLNIIRLYLVDVRRWTHHPSVDGSIPSGPTRAWREASATCGGVGCSTDPLSVGACRITRGR